MRRKKGLPATEREPAVNGVPLKVRVLLVKLATGPEKTGALTKGTLKWVATDWLVAGRE
jgi:hypothetical protein